MLRITTLWFSESISHISETDDVVHNCFFSIHMAIRQSSTDSVTYMYIKTQMYDNTWFVSPLYILRCGRLVCRGRVKLTSNGCLSDPDECKEKGAVLFRLLYPVLSLFQNHTPKHTRMSLMHLEWFSTQYIVYIKNAAFHEL